MYTHTHNGKVWAKSNAIFYNDFAKVFWTKIALASVFIIIVSEKY